MLSISDLDVLQQQYMVHLLVVAWKGYRVPPSLKPRVSTYDKGQLGIEIRLYGTYSSGRLYEYMNCPFRTV